MSNMKDALRTIFDLMAVYGIDMVMVYKREGEDIDNDTHAVSIVDSGGKVYKFHLDPEIDNDATIQKKWELMMLDWENGNAEE
ncbi:MAG TPA: hypothetical protein VMW10_08610 [Alphaproteobacteria bacterium]|nr:hypothetical protein [Alphaproteobacteria bacterium]